MGRTAMLCRSGAYCAALVLAQTSGESLEMVEMIMLIAAIVPHVGMHSHGLRLGIAPADAGSGASIGKVCDEYS